MSSVADHAAAFLALLDADNTPPPLVVLDGRVPTGTRPPYALVYFGVETPDGGQAPADVSLDADSDVIVMRGYVHAVGVDAAAARSVAGRCRALLLNATPVIAGRVVYPIRHDAGQPASRDESTGVLVMDAVDVYRLKSLPA